MNRAPRISLACEEGPKLIELALDTGSRVELGRDPACGVVLEHESVSRRHATIECADGDWTVRDLGSRHGTFVNEAQITEGATTLASGDALVIGPWRWRVLIGRGDDRIAIRRIERSGAETFATRPTIFLRLQASDASQREVSWQEFHARYAPVIRGFVRNAGRSGAEADDIVQEVLLGFFQAAPRFSYDPARGRFRGYLKRCTLNALRRRRGGALSGAAGALSIDEIDPAEDARTDPPWESAWAEQLFERAAHEVASRVDAKTFEAFDLYARRGVPAEEVARRLDIGVNSVHQAKARVMKLIREVVDALRAEEG